MPAAKPTQPKPKKPAVSKPRPGSIISSVKSLNRWRESFNPLAGLTLRVAATLFEQFPRGEFTDLMWTYGAPTLGIESADADLVALIERRTGAVLEMDWQIKTVAPERDKNGAAIWPRGFDEKLADEQAGALREAYEGIRNLYQGIEHLCLATFRGFSHLEKCLNADGDIYHLAIVDQWNIVRDGMRGAWKYNPDAIPTTFAALPENLTIDPSAFVIREVRRHVNRIALLKFVRANLSEKDWDAFIEIYGIPSGVVTMPPNVAEGQQEDYLEAAKAVAEGGSGALPNGAAYTPNDQPRGTNPFAERLRHLSEKLILAGTGGLLTMLTAPTGLGSGVSNSHADTFATLARKEARQINELFQRSIDAEILERRFPGQPAFAYFELNFREEVDGGEVIDDIAKLASAGYLVAPEKVTESTGYEVTVKPTAPIAPGVAPLTNRKPAKSEARPPLGPVEEDPDFSKLVETGIEQLAAATAADLAPLRDAIAQALEGDDEGLPDRMKALEARLADLAPEIMHEPKAAEILSRIFAASLASSLAPTR